jgi:Icc-related predicted phosphoesterase
MKILHLSDTHSCHYSLQKLPAADVIIHSGDVSLAGTSEEVIDFMDWFGELDYKYKIFIAGNHDECLDGKHRGVIQMCLPDKCFYLYNSGIEIEGIKFWGVPFFMSDDIKDQSPQIMAQIPADIDVLITHRPPYGILDIAGNITYGCPYLLQSILRIKPQYHLFGHIHDAYGIEKSNHTIFVNASLMNENYELVNEPVLLEI